MFENPFDTGKLGKMIIQVVTVDNKGQIVPSTDDTLKFTVQVNPESYSLNYNIRYNYLPGHGDTGSEAKHACSAPQQLEFEFLFDGTGVIPKSSGPLDGVPIAGAIADLLSGSEEENVETQIKNFIRVVDYDGNDHKPHILQLAWGTLSFICVLTRLSIEYKLFNADGTPLRALAKATFSNSLPDEFRKLLDRDSSPDLTHARMVSEGDKLPLMANKIYRSPHYYLEVAKKNKLFDFRKLRAGLRLSFPPIDKKAK
jgi:hypothetical protein